MIARERVLLRIAVLVSSLVLVSAYVAYRSAAATSIVPVPRGDNRAPAEMAHVADDATAAPTTGDYEDLLLSGSKSDRIHWPTMQAPAVALPSSKSVILLGPEDVPDASERSSTQPSAPPSE